VRHRYLCWLSVQTHLLTLGPDKRLWSQVSCSEALCIANRGRGQQPLKAESEVKISLTAGHRSAFIVYLGVFCPPRPAGATFRSLWPERTFCRMHASWRKGSGRSLIGVCFGELFREGRYPSRASSRCVLPRQADIELAIDCCQAHRQAVATHHIADISWARLIAVAGRGGAGALIGRRAFGERACGHGAFPNWFSPQQPWPFRDSTSEFDRVRTIRPIPAAASSRPHTVPAQDDPIFPPSTRRKRH